MDRCPQCRSLSSRKDCLFVCVQEVTSTLESSSSLRLAPMAAGCAQEPANSTRRLMNKTFWLVNGVITRHATVKIGKTHSETAAAARNTKQHKRSTATKLPMNPARTRLPQGVASPSGLFSYRRGKRTDLANSQGKHPSFDKVFVSPAAAAAAAAASSSSQSPQATAGTDHAPS